MEPEATRLELESLGPDDRARIGQTLAALEQRGVQPLWAADRRAALEAVLRLLPPGAAIAHGSSTTLQEIGLVDHLQQPDAGYRYMNAEWLAEDDPVRRQRLRARLSVEADVYLGSVQAVCVTGQVVGTDMSGSRQAFYIYGPPRVVWVAGINKLVQTVEDGIRRAEEIALPLEDKRVRSQGGKGSYIGKLVIYERERPGRITLVLVGEELGY
jgi:hypothetical protein